MRKGLTGRALTTITIAIAGLVLVGLELDRFGPASQDEAAARSSRQITASYIVQAASVDAAAAIVHRVGGIVTDELAVIDGVGARLTPEQAQ
ncbi:MAG: hypothetical protein R3305_05090 [Gammaproteobacteria bacterium]|nr:hypothetical protein [Gammaproteobacteria bacterium]